MKTTQTVQGYGSIPSFMEGGMLPQEGMPMEEGGMPPAPEADPMAEMQPMVEAYMQNPDPALAEEIIMGLANVMGISPAPAPAPAQAGAEGGMPPMPQGGGMPAEGIPFEKGGKLSKYLTGLRLS